MTKTEKLILTLCRECFGDNEILFAVFSSGNVYVTNYRNIEWNIDCDSKDFDQQLTTAIKEIREIKRGAK